MTIMKIIIIQKINVN